MPKSGPGVDRLGQAVVDPTANVLDLVAAERRRTDDLRAADQSLSEANLRHVEEMATERHRHSAELRRAESARLDAIRAVDVAAATILANQVRDAAETLRLQVETARIAQAAERDAALQPILSNIAELQRRQYEQAGEKSAVVEGRSSRNDSTNILIALAVLVVLVASFVAPHIH